MDRQMELWGLTELRREKGGREGRRRMKRTRNKRDEGGQSQVGGEKFLWDLVIQLSMIDM